MRPRRLHIHLTRVREGAPMVFRQRNSQRFEMDMSAAEVKRAASAPPQTNSAGADVINGSEILVRCLQAEGVKYLWGYPGGAVLYIYDALYKQDRHRARAGAPRAGRRARGRRLRARHRRCRRRAGHLGPGRHQRGDRHRDGLHGLDPDGDHHRPGADAGDRPGCLPGVRHGRHHAADRQAQLPGQGRARSGADDEEGVPHRAHRTARAGGGGRARRTCR